MIGITFPVATVANGVGTINAVVYNATGVSFTTPANNEVTGTFPTSTSFHQVTAYVTDSSFGLASCTFSVELSEGKNEVGI